MAGYVQGVLSLRKLNGKTMDILPTTVTTTALATIYVIYNRYRLYLQNQVKRDRTLRERVTYMLWCAAEEAC